MANKLNRLLIAFLMLSLFIALTISAPFFGRRNLLGDITDGENMTAAERLYFDNRVSRWDSILCTGQSPSDEISVHSYARIDIVTFSSILHDTQRYRVTAHRGRFSAAPAHITMPLSELVCRKADEFSSFPPALADYTNIRKRE